MIFFVCFADGFCCVLNFYELKLVLLERNQYSLQWAPLWGPIVCISEVWHPKFSVVSSRKYRFNHTFFFLLKSCYFKVRQIKRSNCLNLKVCVLNTGIITKAGNWAFKWVLWNCEIWLDLSTPLPGFISDFFLLFLIFFCFIFCGEH